MEIRIVLVLLGIAAARPAVANPALIASDRFAYASSDGAIVGGAVIAGAPTALPTGLARGLGIAASTGDRLAIGARLGWATVSESTLAWTVRHHEVRARATGEVRHAIGRGVLGLRLGAGGTLVHESRLRNQGARAGLMGSDLATSATALLPAADIDVVIAVHVQGPWLVTMSAGPSFALDGGLLTSWSAEVGIAWQR